MGNWGQRLEVEQNGLLFVSVLEDKTRLTRRVQSFVSGGLPLVVIPEAHPIDHRQN